MKTRLNWKPPYGMHSIIGTNIAILIIGRKNLKNSCLLGVALAFLKLLSESTTKRDAKKVPGHHIQVDVKFLQLKDKDGNTVKRYQYTAIDDATRIRALQIYPKHNQACAIKFIDYVIEKFPFRIGTVRTDRGHEFQARFHWHVEDQGIQHVYIKPRYRI